MLKYISIPVLFHASLYIPVYGYVMLESGYVMLEFYKATCVQNVRAHQKFIRVKPTSPL